MLSSPAALMLARSRCRCTTLACLHTFPPVLMLTFAVTYPARPVITVVGGGFAGTALVLQLRRQPALAQAEIHLIEPREAPGPGLAYTARRPEYLLNVRPGALSLYPDAPQHFADWLGHQPESAAGVPEFAARTRLRPLPARRAGRPCWRRPPARQACIGTRPPPWLLPFAPTAAAPCSWPMATILKATSWCWPWATSRPRRPAGPDHRYLHHPGYHADPWATGNLRRIGPDEEVLLIGSGLTAVDVLLALRQDGHRAPVTVVARHGRWPAAHGPASGRLPQFLPRAGRRNHRKWRAVAVFKRHLRAAAAQGIDWRPVLDSLRPDLGRIWAAWPLTEQRRFLRHLAGLWAVGAPPQSTPERSSRSGTNGRRAGALHLGTVREIIPDGDLGCGCGCAPTAKPGCWHHGPTRYQLRRPAARLRPHCRPAGDEPARGRPPLPRPIAAGLLTDAHGALLDASGTVTAGLVHAGRPAAARPILSRRPCRSCGSRPPRWRPKLPAGLRQLRTVPKSISPG